MDTENAAAIPDTPEYRIAVQYAPPSLTRDQKESVLSLMEDGTRLGQIAQSLGIHKQRIIDAAENDPAFGKAYRQTQTALLQDYAERLLTIADDEPDIQRAALHSRNWQWVLSRRLRAEYGDSVDVRVTERVDVGSILSEARARLRARTVDAETLQVLPVNPAPDSPLADSIEDALR
jgi:hypothetical protein